MGGRLTGFFCFVILLTKRKNGGAAGESEKSCVFCGGRQGPEHNRGGAAAVSVAAGAQLTDTEAGAVLRGDPL